jgi:hypothetical protein
MMRVHGINRAAFRTQKLRGFHLPETLSVATMRRIGYAPMLEDRRIVTYVLTRCEAQKVALGGWAGMACRTPVPVSRIKA